MKIHSQYPESINQALKENLPELELAIRTEADIVLPLLPLPVKLGEILDFISQNSSRQLNLGKLRVDLNRKTITGGNKQIDITEKEAEIISYLSNRKTPASREEMLAAIWNYSKDTDSKTVENHIYRLRQKVLAAGLGEIITTEAGNYKIS